MTNPWKEPGLFTDYHTVKTEYGYGVTLEKSGEVELAIETYDGEFYAWLTIDELERLARAARALKEYDEAETRRVEALREVEEE